MRHLVLLVVLLVLAGCVRASQVAGVENHWRRQPTASFQQGTTTKSDVLKALGPPSQIIALHDETVFYYLLEESKVDGFAAILYNDIKINVSYDRAIFFFDGDGRLVDFSYSSEIAGGAKKSC